MENIMLFISDSLLRILLLLESINHIHKYVHIRKHARNHVC
jgi:hypothetical protein